MRAAQKSPLTPANQAKAVTASKSLQFFSHYEIRKILDFRTTHAMIR